MIDKEYLAIIDIYKRPSEAEYYQYHLKKDLGYRIRVFDPDAKEMYRIDRDDPPDCVISGWGPACGVVDVLHDDIVRYGFSTSIIIASSRPPLSMDEVPSTVRAVMYMSDISRPEGRQLIREVIRSSGERPPGRHEVIWTAAARREALNEIELDRRILSTLRNVYLSQRG